MLAINLIFYFASLQCFLKSMQVLQLYILFYCLQLSVQMSINREMSKKSTIVGQASTDTADDAVKFTQTIQSLKHTLTSTDPLSVWLIRDRYPTLETLKMNLVKMASCIINQENLRLQLVLLKVLKGEAINVVVYGGSNCAQGMFPVIFHDWWTKVITPISGSRLNLKVIGIGGTGSGYYQFCHGVYLGEDETIDLAILETAVNDVLNIVFKTPNVSRSLPLEQLSRQILNRRNNPAVFYVNLFIEDEQTSQCINLVDYGQSLISEVYAITTFNLRCLCCRLLKGKFYSDARTGDVQEGWHSNLLGHAQIALMMIHVISNTLIKTAQDMNRIAVNDLSASWLNALNSKIPPLPSPVFIKGETRTIRSTKCWSNLTPNYEENMIHNNLHWNVVKKVGFKYINNVTIGKASYSAEDVTRTDAFSGFFGHAINSEVTLLFTVSARSPRSESTVHKKSSITITSQRSEGLVSSGSVGIISRYGPNAGTVEAWLDNRYEKRVRISLGSNKSQTAIAMLATQVQIGIHTLTLRIVEEGQSVLVGLFTGPANWP